MARGKRSSRTSRSSGSSSIIQNLLSGKHSGDTNHVYSQLKMKYGNDAEVMNKIYSGYRERLDEIRNVATKFKVALFNHYDLDTMSFDDLLRKAKKYQKVYNISSDEFKLFLDLAMNDKKYAKQMEHMLPNTVMASTLGISSFTNFADQLNVDKKGMPYVQAILELHAATTTKHRELVIQSLTSTNANMFDKDKWEELYDSLLTHRNLSKYQHVHPVLFAMFAKKIEAFDERMIIANMGNIIKCKVEGRPIKTKPEYDLHWAMVSDPNDINCDISNPMQDIFKRFTLQTEIWNAVSNLRENKLLYPEAANFISALEDCRSNIYDVPELSKIMDEGTIMRKIMGAFSMRPFVTKISPFGSSSAGNSILGAMASYTTVPMINVRLSERPNNLFQRAMEKIVNEDEKTKEDNKIKAALKEQYNWFIDNGQVTPKIQSVVHINEIAVFNIIRNQYSFSMQNFLDAPNKFDSLPLHLFEHTSTDFNTAICTDNGEKLKSIDTEINDSAELTFCSAVCVETTNIKDKQVIVGSAASVNNIGVYSPLSVDQSDIIKDNVDYSKINTTGTLLIYTTPKSTTTTNTTATVDNDNKEDIEKMSKSILLNNLLGGFNEGNNEYVKGILLSNPIPTIIEDYGENIPTTIQGNDIINSLFNTSLQTTKTNFKNLKTYDSIQNWLLPDNYIMGQLLSNPGYYDGVIALIMQQINDSAENVFFEEEEGTDNKQQLIDLINNYINNHILQNNDDLYHMLTGEEPGEGDNPDDGGNGGEEI